MRYKFVVFTLFFLAYYGCGIKAPLFSLHSYSEAVELKVEALNLIEKADSDYVENLPLIGEIKLKTEKAYEFSKGRADNEISTAMWEIIMDPDGYSFYNFLELWRRSGQLSEVFIGEKKKIIAAHFDKIISYESEKPEK